MLFTVILGILDANLQYNAQQCENANSSIRSQLNNIWDTYQKVTKGTWFTKQARKFIQNSYRTRSRERQKNSSPRSLKASKPKQRSLRQHLLTTEISLRQSHLHNKRHVPNKATDCTCGTVSINYNSKHLKSSNIGSTRKNKNSTWISNAMLRDPLYTIYQILVTLQGCKYSSKLRTMHIHLLAATRNTSEADTIYFVQQSIHANTYTWSTNFLNPWTWSESQE